MILIIQQKLEPYNKQSYKTQIQRFVYVLVEVNTGIQNVN